MNSYQKTFLMTQGWLITAIIAFIIAVVLTIWYIEPNRRKTPEPVATATAVTAPATPATAQALPTPTATTDIVVTKDQLEAAVTHASLETLLNEAETKEIGCTLTIDAAYDDIWAHVGEVTIRPVDSFDRTPLAFVRQPDGRWVADFPARFLRERSVLEVGYQVTTSGTQSFAAFELVEPLNSKQPATGDLRFVPSKFLATPLPAAEQS